MSTDGTSVTAFSETAALYAIMQDDPDEARRICTAMSRTERTEFAARMLALREILDDLNATRCLHCGERVAKVHASRIRGGSLNVTYWYHLSNSATVCPTGGTMADPAPQED